MLRRHRVRPGRRAEARAARVLDRWVGRLLRGRRPDRALDLPGDRRAAVVAARLHAAWMRESEPSERFMQSLAEQVAKQPTRAAAVTPVRGPSRRQFALGMASGGALVAAAALALRRWGTDWFLVGTRQVPPVPGGPSGVTSARWVPLGAVERYRPGTVVPTMAAGNYILVVGGPDGPTVLSGLCTDLQCPLQVSAAAGDLVCPCHGARFDRSGRFLPGGYWTHLADLPQLPTRITNGQIQVRL